MTINLRPRTETTAKNFSQLRELLFKESRGKYIEKCSTSFFSLAKTYFCFFYFPLFCDSTKVALLLPLPKLT